MRHQLATIPLLATLTTTAVTLAACDSNPKSIGSLDAETGESSSGDGDGDPGSDEGDGDSEGLCGPSLVDLEFDVNGFGIGSEVATLTCAAEVVETSGGYQVLLNACTDAQEQPTDAVILITLEGNWAEPLVHGEPHIEVRYVELNVVINEEVTTQRWLSLRNPGGQHPLALIAVDAISTYPSAFGDYEFDYAPLAVDPVPTDCPLIENVACAPIQPGAMVVSIEDQPFEIPEGHELGIGVNGDNYHVVVEQSHGLVDDCLGLGNPGDEYMFNIVATPS